MFRNALGYAAELGLLPASLLARAGWKAPATSGAVNPLMVASPAQIHTLLTTSTGSGRS